MNENLRQQLGDALRQEFKHRPRNGVVCAKCGAEGRPLAAHVAVFLNGNPGLEQRSWVPQATSYAPDRGAPALCDRCAPPCAKCGQPYLDRATAKWLTALPGFKPANGYCKDHIKIFGFTF